MVKPHVKKSVRAADGETVAFVVARVERVGENQHVVEKIFRAQRVVADDNAPMSAVFDIFNHNRRARRKIVDDKFFKRFVVFNRRRVKTAVDFPTDVAEKFHHVAQTRADKRFDVHFFDERCLVEVAVAEVIQHGQRGDGSATVIGRLKCCRVIRQDDSAVRRRERRNVYVREVNRIGVIYVGGRGRGTSVIGNFFVAFSSWLNLFKREARFKSGRTIGVSRNVFVRQAFSTRHNFSDVDIFKRKIKRKLTNFVETCQISSQEQFAKQCFKARARVIFGDGGFPRRV